MKSFFIAVSFLLAVTAIVLSVMTFRRCEV